MMDSGKVAVYSLENVAEPGDMPRYALKIQEAAQWFEERSIGYGRQYDAKGVKEQVDLLARIWRTPVRIGWYAVVSDSPYEGQYRIDNVQNFLDDDGLQVTDLTLYRLEKLYEVDGEA